MDFVFSFLRDYGVSYESEDSTLSSIISLALSVLLIVSYWKMFQKAGQPGWKAIVPLYNGYTLTSLVFSSGWFFLLAIIPIANIVFYCMLCVRLARAYGRGTGFGVLTIFFPYVCFPIIAFSSNYYYGNPAFGGAMGGYQQGGYPQYPQQGYDPYQQNNYGQNGVMPNNNYDQGYYGQNGYNQNNNNNGF